STSCATASGCADADATKRLAAQHAIHRTLILLLLPGGGRDLQRPPRIIPLGSCCAGRGTVKPPVFPPAGQNEELAAEQHTQRILLADRRGLARGLARREPDQRDQERERPRRALQLVDVDRLDVEPRLREAPAVAIERERRDVLRDRIELGRVEAREAVRVPREQELDTRLERQDV